MEFGVACETLLFRLAPGFDHTQASTGAAVTQIDIREQIAKCVDCFFSFRGPRKGKTLFSLLLRLPV